MEILSCQKCHKVAGSRTAGFPLLTLRTDGFSLEDYAAANEMENNNALKTKQAIQTRPLQPRH